MFLGENLLAYLVLAVGGALIVGNGLALLRPPSPGVDGAPVRAPVGRTVTMMVIGVVAAIWALATLTS